MAGAQVPANIPPIEEWICRPLLCPNDAEWWELISGVLLQLSYGYYYDKNSGDWEAAKMAGLQMVLAWGNQDECSGSISTLKSGCHDYNLESSIISWEPNDPFRTPDYIPDGYALPPWYKVGITIPFTGLQPGDVITDLLHSPFNTLASGFPRFRINLNGAGTVALHLLRFATASIVLVTVDDNPSTARWQDLNSTLVPSIGEYDPVSIMEVDVIGEGSHHIDVTIISSVGESFPFVHFGGGIRKIVLCGFDNSVQNPIIEWEEEMSLCDNLRFENGVLQVMCCGEWTDVSGQEGGLLPSGVGQPSGQSRPTAGQSKCFQVELAANQRWQLPFAVLPGDIVTITEISGTWSDGGLAPWYVPDGHTAVFGLSTGSGQGHAGGDPDATEYHMQLIAIAGMSDYYSGTDGPFVIAGSGSQTLTLQANDDSLDNNNGTIKFKVCVENGGTPAPSTWCYTFDFRLADYGFVPDTRDGFGGVWESGFGWKADPALGTGICSIKRILASMTNITHVEQTWNCTLTDATSSQAGVFLPVPTLASLVNPLVTSGEVSDTSDGSWDTTVIQVAAQAYGVAPLFYMQQLTLGGDGDNPFGLDNC